MLKDIGIFSSSSHHPQPQCHWPSRQSVDQMSTALRENDIADGTHLMAKVAPGDPKVFCGFVGKLCGNFGNHGCLPRNLLGFPGFPTNLLMFQGERPTRVWFCHSDVKTRSKNSRMRKIMRKIINQLKRYTNDIWRYIRYYIMYYWRYDYLMGCHGHLCNACEDYKLQISSVAQMTMTSRDQATPGLNISHLLLPLRSTKNGEKDFIGIDKYGNGSGLSDTSIVDHHLPISIQLFWRFTASYGHFNPFLNLKIPAGWWLSHPSDKDEFVSWDD